MEEEHQQSESDQGAETSDETPASAPPLSAEEVRVLGSLLEKEMTTPEHYPLTLNALTAACNQKSNREPVVEFDASKVANAVEELRCKHLAVSVHEHGSRSAKTKHTLDRAHPYLANKHLALLGVLFLRGQQTLGELRKRTERMHPFADMESAQAALDELIAYEPEPLVKRIPVGGGRRVETYVHLLSGDAEPSAGGSPAPATPREVEAPSWRGEIESAIASLRGEVAELRKDVAELRGRDGG